MRSAKALLKVIIICDCTLRLAMSFFPYTIFLKIINEQNRENIAT